MTFTDDLTLVLDLLILVAATVFYTGLLVWFQVRRKDLVRANTHLREGATLLGTLGGVLGIIAIWGETSWPLPGQFNLFFFDVLTMLAIVLVSFAVAVWRKLPTHFVGLVSVLAGLGVLFYGVRAYQLGLTLDPFDTLLMYLAFGVAAIFAYPATLYIDWFVVGPTSAGSDPMPSTPIPEYPWIWRVLLTIFLVAIFFAGFAAVGYGIDAAWGHLASPP